MLLTIMFLVQFAFSVIIGVYFFRLVRKQNNNKTAKVKESSKELIRFKKLHDIKLSVPLSEKTRPASLRDIVGQEDGIKALRAALCCPNPQHVIIYGPPGVGKTAAARVILEEAKTKEYSPFGKDAKYVEIDATTLRFDDRGIADPLIGSVHDPIYQGAGAYGQSGIPQPKLGAVTKAHGGMLFIDEIGELHPMQMNKLLKVLEDRKVYPESAYYSADDSNIPMHIHEMFQKGLPADFRLVAATTRAPEELPPAIRSRCVEVFFRPLETEEIKTIAGSAADKGGFSLSEGCLDIVAGFAESGRDAINIVQTAGSVALLEGRSDVSKSDIEWVLEFGRYSPKFEKKVTRGRQTGFVNGLAVFGMSYGTIMDIEVTATISEKGSLVVTGIVEQEEFDNRGGKLKKESSASSSVKNMLTILKRIYGIDYGKYDIHINFPCSSPVDGPSAGIAIVCAVYSAIMGIPVDCELAMTGEISIHGNVKAVGGVTAKIKAAEKAGVKKVLIPADNYQEIYSKMNIDVVAVKSIQEVFGIVFSESLIGNAYTENSYPSGELLTAASLAASLQKNA